MKTIILALILWTTISPAQSVAVDSKFLNGLFEDKEQRDISELVASEGVDPVTSALLIVRLEDGVEWVSGGSRIEARYSPASTSKIPHTLIALETGYADGPDTFFKWDGTQRFFDAWNQDQTVASAYSISAVCVYQQIARDLGHETMSDWIRQFEYGNRNIGSIDDLTTYWLRGLLEISACEQIQFLSKLASGDLPLKPQTLGLGKQIMHAEKGEDWTLYAKTGWWSDGENVDIGWYVGWLEKLERGEQHTYLFAFNMDMTEKSDRAKRKSVARTAFSMLGMIPE